MDCCVISTASYSIHEEQEKQTLVQMHVIWKIASFSVETEA